MDNHANLRLALLGTPARLAVVLFLINGCGVSNRPDESPDPGDYSHLTVVRPASPGLKLDRIVGRAGGGLFSGSVLVSVADTVLLCKGYGVAHRGTRRPNSAVTLFDIGSLTAPFIAIAILQLFEEEKLSLRDRLPMFFENVPDDKKNITVHHLLSHTSGLFGVHGDADVEELTGDEAIDKILQQKLRFDPGAEYGQTHTDYTLAAAIVELRSGMSWTDYLRTRILDPAGMSFTCFAGDPVMLDAGVAHGYNEDRDMGSPYSWPGPYWGRGETGGLVSNIVDLEKFGRALLSGTLVLPSSFRRLFGAGVLEGLYTPGEYTDQGDCSVNYFGWNCKDSGGLRFHESGGTMLNGHHALFRWEPVRKIVIIILSNDGGVQHEDSLIKVELLNKLREAVIKGRS